MFLYFIGTVAGDSFGELALINKEAVRNASIITDDIVDLMQIDRNTYETTLKVSSKLYLRSFVILNLPTGLFFNVQEHLLPNAYYK